MQRLKRRSFVLAIDTCDLAELLGSALHSAHAKRVCAPTSVWTALNLGVCIIALDVLALLILQGKGFRHEGLAILLVATVEFDSAQRFCFRVLMSLEFHRVMSQIMKSCIILRSSTLRSEFWVQLSYCTICIFILRY